MLAGVEGPRTPDLRFWRPLLFQLSYTPGPFESINAPPGSEARATPLVPLVAEEALEVAEQILGGG